MTVMELDEEVDLYADIWGKETPRIFTQPLRELHPDRVGPLGVIEKRTTEGYRCITFAEDVCGIELFPWQRWFLIHALELKPNGRFRFRTIVLLVGRQNGKSMLSIVLSLFFIYILKKKMVLGTAQDLDVAEEIWASAVEIAQAVPVLDECISKVVLTNGSKSVRLATGERYKVKAANRRAGRSLSAQLVMLDELREHQTWDAWGAITKTTMAQADALILGLSNAGDASSVVLRHLRELAHRALGDPDGLFKTDEAMAPVPKDVRQDHQTTVAIFEWSATPNANRWDVEEWAQANPSVGWNENFLGSTIAAAASTDPEWVFRTEVLCQWSDGTLVGAFPSGSWEATSDPASEPGPGKVAIGIDTSHDRTITRMFSATERDDGSIHVELIAHRPGQEWVLPWITDPAKPHRREYRYTGQANGAPVSSLIADLEAALDDDEQPLDLDIVPWKGDELARGMGRFFDAVTRRDEEGAWSPRVFHRPTSTLDVAAAVAKTRPLGDGWLWDRKGSAMDISALIAANAAHWLITQREEAEPRSAYEDNGLELI